MARANQQRKQDNLSISPEVISKLNQAVNLHQENELKQAEKLYKSALIASGHHPEVSILCAIFFQQIGRHKYVITLLKKIISKNEFNGKAQHIIGKSYLAEKQYENALEALGRAHALDGGNAEICFKKGFCHHKMGQMDLVQPLYEKAYAGKESLAEADLQSLYNSFSDLLMATGKKDEAIPYLEEAVAKNVADYTSFIRLVVAIGETDPASLKHVINAMLLETDGDCAKAVLAFCCEKGNAPSYINDQMKELITACLKSRIANHQSLSIPWIRNLFLSEDRENAREFMKVQTYEDFVEDFNQDDFQKLFFNEYFYLGLRNIRSINLDMDRFYQFFRLHYLVTIKQNETLLVEGLSLLSAMAEQCYLNEYVFYVTDEEMDFIDDLKAKLEKLTSFSEKDFQDILLYASYAPLLSLSNHHLLESIKAPSYLDDVITIHCREPLQELRLQKKIKSIGTIKNEVSQTVRLQYEENPYPRWKTESIFKPFHSQVIDEKYHREIDVLIAGCGTGKHIVSTFNFYPNANFTAIDISKASLGYAKRKLIEYGLGDKVKLLHCDILDARTIDKQFDFIECCGVLHHMENPLEGLKSIVSRLKPEGRIKLAYYSTLARQSVIDAREFIQKEGYEPTPSGIRECRKVMVDTLFSKNTNFPIYKWRDFHSLSECRDLMFHVQETCYNFLEIEQMLQDAGLEFESMLVGPGVKQAYVEKFPDDPEAKNLKNWAEFEEEHPATFSAMYQFNAVKR